jgi:hypothetical protein
MASKCTHLNKPHYSSGLCQSCYLAQYYQKRKKKMLDKEDMKKKSDSSDKLSEKSEKSEKSNKFHDTEKKSDN